MDVPRLRAEDREQLELTLEAWRSGRRRSLEQPPWVIPHALLKSDAAVRADPALAAEVHALQLDSRGQPWLVRGFLKATSRGLCLTRVAIEHFEEPDTEVTELRDRPQFGRIRNQAIARLRAQVHDRGRLAAAATDWLPTPEEEEQLSKLSRHLSRPRPRPGRRGRVGYDNEHWRELALEYLARRERGQKDAAGEIAKARHLSRDTVRTELQTHCIDRGFLISRGRGHPYEAGPNLRKEKDDA